LDSLDAIEAELARLNQRIHACGSFDAAPEDLLDEYVAVLDHWTKVMARREADRE